MFSRHGRGSVTYEMHPGDLTDLEESASHPSPSTRVSAPSNIDALSEYPSGMSVSKREHLTYRHTFAKT